MENASSSNQVLENLSCDKAVELIFQENAHYDITDASLNGLDNAQDAFWFLTKILKDGIVFLFKDEKGDVDLDVLTDTDFEKINRCMQKLGVNVEMKVSIPSNPQEVLRHQQYLEDLQKKDLKIAMSYFIVNHDPSKLENHILLLITQTKIIVVGFTYCTYA